MVKDPVKHSCGEDGVAHHLSPIDNLLVCRKDDGRRFIGIADEGEESVGLSPADRCIADLIKDNQLGFLNVAEPEACGPFRLGGVQYLDQVCHFFKADAFSYRFFSISFNIFNFFNFLC